MLAPLVAFIVLYYKYYFLGCLSKRSPHLLRICSFINKFISFQKKNDGVPKRHTII